MITVFNFFRFIILPIFFFFFKVKVNFIPDNKKTYIYVFLITLIYVLFITLLKVLKLRAGNYEFFDAGLILNEIHNLSILNPAQIFEKVFFSGHFRPFLFIYVYIYKFFLSFEILFLIQTISIASSIWPIYLILRQFNFTNKYLIFLCFFFLFNPITSFIDILGFHIDHLIIPFASWAFYFYFKKNNYKSIILLVLISLISEVYILTAAFMSLVFFDSKFKKIFFSLFFSLFFILIFFYILPLKGSINASHSVFVGNTAYKIIMDLNFVNFKKTFFDLYKIYYIYFFVLLFGFFFLKNFYILIAAIPSLLKILLSIEFYHYDLTGHYNGDIFVIFYIAMIIELSKLYNNNKTLFHFNLRLIYSGLMSLIIAHSVFPLSLNFWLDTSAGTYNFKNYIKSVSQYEDTLLLSPSLLVNKKICLNNGPFPQEIYKLNVSFLTPNSNFEKNLELCDIIIINTSKKIFTSGSHSSQTIFNEKIYKFSANFSNYNFIKKKYNLKYVIYEKK
ncbi:COG3463 Predicted membrane protein [Candidatus Pelagibacterales bacterium]